MENSIRNITLLEERILRLLLGQRRKDKNRECDCSLGDRQCLAKNYPRKEEEPYKFTICKMTIGHTGLHKDHVGNEWREEPY